MKNNIRGMPTFIKLMENDYVVIFLKMNKPTLRVRAFILQIANPVLRMVIFQNHLTFLCLSGYQGTGLSGLTQRSLSV
jgi:hypothetical protein